MSCITKVQLKLRDLDALDTAVKPIGLTLHRNAKSFKSWGRSQKCEHKLALTDADQYDYEIGLVKAADGDGFEPEVDWYGQARLQKAAGGLNMNAIRREYAAAVAIKQAAATLARSGFTTTRENLANGRIRLRLRAR